MASDNTNINMIFGQPLSDPILGAYYSLPAHALFKEQPVQDYSMRIIPAYQHMKMYKVEPIEIPSLVKCQNDAQNKLRVFKWIGKSDFSLGILCEVF